MSETPTLEETRWSHIGQSDVSKISENLVSPVPLREMKTTWNSVDPSGAFVGDPLRSLIDQWVNIACRHARTRRVGAHIFADVVGVDGAWAQGTTAEEALVELRSVLTEWVQLKLEDADDDIPPMEGVRLTVDP